MANDDVQDFWMKVGNRTFSGLRGKALKFNRPLSPSRVNSLPKGTDFTVEINPAGILIGLLRTAVQKVREASTKGTPFDYKVRTMGSGRAIKVEAISVKFKTTESNGQTYLIKFRKVQ